MAFSRRRHGDELVSSAIIMAESQNPKKTGLGAEGEEKAILPSPVDCLVPASLSLPSTPIGGRGTKLSAYLHLPPQFVK